MKKKNRKSEQTVKMKVAGEDVEVPGLDLSRAKLHGILDRAWNFFALKYEEGIHLAKPEEVELMDKMEELLRNKSLYTSVLAIFSLLTRLKEHFDYYDKQRPNERSENTIALNHAYRNEATSAPGPETKEHNYMKVLNERLDEIAEGFIPDHIYRLTVLHEPWCHLVVSNAMCNCNATIEGLPVDCTEEMRPEQWLNYFLQKKKDANVKVSFDTTKPMMERTALRAGTMITINSIEWALVRLPSVSMFEGMVVEHEPSKTQALLKELGEDHWELEAINENP